MGVFRKAVKLFASLQVAVVIILAIGVISAVGTFVESAYDMEISQKFVYHSIYMYGALGALCVTLIAVMIDRWPWKARHLPFLLAHVGILVLIAGSVVTRVFGVDGSMAFKIGESNRYIMVNQREISLFSTLDGQSYQRIFHQPVEFLLSPPTPQRPFKMNVGSQSVSVVDYIHYGLRQEEMVRSQDRTDPPAVRFRIESDRAKVAQTHWLYKETAGAEGVVDLGPAQVVLNNTRPVFRDRNEVVFWYDPREPDKLHYSVFSIRRKGQTKAGLVRAGEAFTTDWMDMRVLIINHYPAARKKVTFTDNKKPNDFTTPAIKVLFDGQEHWTQANSVLRLYGAEKMVAVSFGNKRIDAGFDLKLVDFRVGRYPGTARAASYESDVDVPGRGTINISMNNPLKEKGFTFYQASFQEDESGKPTVSVLSVNRDPGRWLKYLGSLILTLGTALLFYNRRVRALVDAKNKKEVAA
jgi:hypothetical protein